MIHFSCEKRCRALKTRCFSELWRTSSSQVGEGAAETKMKYCFLSCQRRSFQEVSLPIGRFCFVSGCDCCLVFCEDEKNMQLKTKTVGMTPKESYNEAREASAVKFPVPVRFPSSVFIVATTISNQHVMPKRPPKGRRRYEKSNSLHLISLEAYLLPLHRSSAAQTRVNGSTFRKQREIIS